MMTPRVSPNPGQLLSSEQQGSLQPMTYDALDSENWQPETEQDLFGLAVIPPRQGQDCLGAWIRENVPNNDWEIYPHSGLAMNMDMALEQDQLNIEDEIPDETPNTEPTIMLPKIDTFFQPTTERIEPAQVPNDKSNSTNPEQFCTAGPLQPIEQPDTEGTVDVRHWPQPPWCDF